jgi:hypothetical protein
MSGMVAGTGANIACSAGTVFPSKRRIVASERQFFCDTPVLRKGAPCAAAPQQSHCIVSDNRWEADHAGPMTEKRRYRGVEIPELQTVGKDQLGPHSKHRKAPHAEGREN